MFGSKTDPITLTHAHKLADVVCVIFAPALAFLHLVQRHRPHPAYAHGCDPLAGIIRPN